MLRTATCGQLTKQDIDTEVVLCGWVFRRRDHGKLVFIDLRDRYGFTQVVFIPSQCKTTYALAQELRSEFVVRVRGKVNERPKGTVNQKINTGEIELMVLEVEVLSRSETPPFQIDDDIDITEEMRLQHRYLDLRRPKMLNNMVMRHQVFQLTRNFLTKENFDEIDSRGSARLFGSFPFESRKILCAATVTANF